MKLKINIWRILGVLAIAAFAILFFKIVIYLGISLVLFLLGYPITYRIEKLRLGRKKLPAGLAALLTIGILVGAIVGLFLFIIPPLASEIDFLYTLNFYDVFHNILNQFPAIKSLLLKFGSEDELKNNLSQQFNRFLSTGNIGQMVNNAFEYLGAIVGGTLCVLFMTFFFLKDEGLVKESLLLLSPSGTETAMRDIFRTSKRMLTNYFAALFLDMLIVGCLVMMVLSIVGIKNALIIAFCAAILNIIPYIGSVITMIIAIVLGVSGCLSAGSYELIAPTINRIFFSLLSINLIDGFVIQPYIFSSSVKAHPLEVFIVTLMAATLGGIFGMVIALPVYTILRIVAKEFLTHLKFFKRISDPLSD